jgi:hypothetical protein
MSSQLDESLMARIAAISAFILVALVVLGLGQPTRSTTPLMPLGGHMAACSGGASCRGGV